jgi:mRNA interferase MazF
MAPILRGSIHWADMNPLRGHEQAGMRPVLILSHDVFNERSLSSERIGKRMGQVSPEELAQIIEGLNEIVGD